MIGTMFIEILQKISWIGTMFNNFIIIIFIPSLLIDYIC